MADALANRLASWGVHGGVEVAWEGRMIWIVGIIVLSCALLHKARQAEHTAAELRVELAAKQECVAEQEAEIRELKRELLARDEKIAQFQAGIRAITEASKAEIDRLNAQVWNMQASAPEDSRFRKLRALIVKELHPDHAPAGSVDRVLRSEVFKALWPKIEAISEEAAV
jgi:septal ring factor EnvC (AmiA/AmiB activator)